MTGTQTLTELTYMAPFLKFKPHIEIEENSCTVTGYGKPSPNAPILGWASYWEDKTTDGSIREAQLEILNNEVCSDYMLDSSLNEEQSDMNMTNLVCAGGNGNEKACFVSRSDVQSKFVLTKLHFTGRDGWWFPPCMWIKWSLLFRRDGHIRNGLWGGWSSQHVCTGLWVCGMDTGQLWGC